LARVMPHRMEIELTSARDDGFTWRAAGARQPKGVIEQSLLPSGAKVGDVVRVEAEVEIDGITILSVLPPKEKTPVKGRIEVIGTPRPAPGVTTVLAGPTGRRRPGDRDRDFDRDRGRERGDRAGRPERRGPDRESRGPRTPGPAGRTASGQRREREPRPAAAAAAGADGGHDEGSVRRPSERRPPRDSGRGRETEHARPGPGRGRPRGEAEAPEGRGPARPPARRGPIRLEPGTKHRDELFGRLSPEERTIAERLATGGLPGLRRAIAEEQARARQEGRPQVSGDPLVAIAERLQPDVQAAVWLDRAEAVVDKMEEVSLRDLRTTVAGATPRDESGRELERRLREGLGRRLTKLRTDWEEHLRQALDDGRVLQALRLSGRPPEPTARFPAALVAPLVTQASAAMTADTAPERWLALLEAAVVSPVRRQIKPEGIPKDENGQVDSQARLAAGRIPALAPLLGMAMPPPPQPLPGDRVARPGGRVVARIPRVTRPPRPARPARPAPGRGGERPSEGSRPTRSERGARAERAERPQQAAEPGSAVVEPEAAVVEPEAAAVEPEAAVVEPEAAETVAVMQDAVDESPELVTEPGPPEEAEVSQGLLDTVEDEPPGPAGTEASLPSPGDEAVLDEPVEQAGDES